MTDRLSPSETTADLKASYTEGCYARAGIAAPVGDKLVIARSLADYLAAYGHDPEDIALIGNLLKAEGYTRHRAAKQIAVVTGKMGLGIPDAPLVPRHQP